MTRAFVWHGVQDSWTQDSDGTEQVERFDAPGGQFTKVNLERVIISVSVGFSAFADEAVVLPDQTQAIVQGDIVCGFTGFPDQLPSEGVLFHRPFYLPVAPQVVAQAFFAGVPTNTTYFQQNVAYFDGDITTHRRSSDDSAVVLLLDVDTPIHDWVHVDRDPFPPRVTLRYWVKVLWSYEVDPL